MADNIVTRLRSIPTALLANAAADEIERLTRQRDGWQATAAGLSQDISNAEDEIERLRAELEEAYDACRYALADSPRWQENCATVIATWEARRG